MTTRSEHLGKFDGACKKHKSYCKRKALAPIAQAESGAGGTENCKMFDVMRRPTFLALNLAAPKKAP
jgi:hypothetical protein